MSMRIKLVVLALTALLLAAGCARMEETQEQVRVPGGDPERGQQAFAEFGCQSCHSIPGVDEADALVGPPLNGWADRSFIAGQFPNEPENLIRWIMEPQEMIPGTAMPDMGVPEQTARDMAAYLYTLRE
jgi:cytochrome c2